MGCRPFSFTAAALANISAEAPSEIELEFAAVTVPSSLNAGLSVGILSIFALCGCSSSVTIVSPLRDFTVTATVSSLSEPSSIAFFALVRDSMANASMSSLVSWYLSAISCAKEPISRPVFASSRASVNIES